MRINVPLERRHALERSVRVSRPTQSDCWAALQEKGAWLFCISDALSTWIGIHPRGINNLVQFCSTGFSKLSCFNNSFYVRPKDLH